MNVTVAAAAFLIAAGNRTPSFFGFSFGQQWYDQSYQYIDTYARDVGKPLSEASRLGCCDGRLLHHTYVHDAAGHGDLFNVVLRTAEACSDLCCEMDDCQAFQWSSNQSTAAGNCSLGSTCCWVKPTAGRLEHWTFNDTAGSLEYDMVSGVKNGLTFTREFERASVEVNCALTTATIAYKQP